MCRPWLAQQLLGSWLWNPTTNKPRPTNQKATENFQTPFKTLNPILYEKWRPRRQFISTSSIIDIKSLKFQNHPDEPSVQNNVIIKNGNKKEILWKSYDDESWERVDVCWHVVKAAWESVMWNILDNILSNFVGWCIVSGKQAERAEATTTTHGMILKNTWIFIYSTSNSKASACPSSKKKKERR